MTQRRRDEALARIEEQRGRKWKDTVIYLPGRTILWEDFLDSVGGEHLELPQAFDVPRSMVVMAARMNGILPIDTPYPDLENREGFIAEERKARASGFAGVLLVTPNQIPWTHICFSPSKEEIEYAEAVINAVNEAKNAGRSVAKLNGKMIGPPMQKRAEKVIALHKLICNKDG